MNWKPSGIGAEPKKLAILGVLVLIALVAYLYSRNSSEEGATSSRPVASTAPAASAAAGRAVVRPVSRSVRVSQNGIGKNPREFRPSMKLPKDFDTSAIDPTLHLSSLTRLQDVKVDGVSRSLFEISAAPPPDVKVGPEPAKIKPKEVFVGPIQPLPPPPKAIPNAPPIPLKFYGFVNPARPDVKRAFFLEGEDIVIAGEGDLIKKRYKVVRIGINSAEVEDTQFKGNNTKQTLPLEVEQTG